MIEKFYIRKIGTKAKIGDKVDFYDESSIERGAIVTDIHIHISYDGEVRVTYELINGGQRYKVRESDLVSVESKELPLQVIVVNEKGEVDHA